MAALNAAFIFGVCLLGFLLYCCVAVPLVVFVLALWKGEPSDRWLVHGLLAVGISYVALLFGYYSWSTRGTAVFQMAFGFVPPTEVIIEDSDHYVPW